MKGGVTTNLLGRRVRITIGLTDEELTREIERMKRQVATVWRGDARAHLGEFGEVTAVFKDGEHALQFTLALDGGNFATVHAQHCRLLPDERSARVQQCEHGNAAARCETCATGMDGGATNAAGEPIE